MRPFAEVLSSEILAFEIASDSVAVATEASFHGAGAATVIPVVAGVTNVSFGITSGTTVAFAGQAVTPTDIEVEGSAGVDAKAQAASLVTFSAAGTATVVAYPGYARETETAITAGSTVAFESVDEPGFDISGSSLVEFQTEVVAETGTAIESDSVVDFVGTAVNNTKGESTGGAVVDARVNFYGNATADSASEASAAFAGQFVAYGELQSVGGSALNGRGQALIYADAAAAGASVLDFQSNALLRANTVASITGASSVAFYTNAQFNVVTDFEAAGEGAMLFQLAAVNHAVASATGTSELVFRRGREVQPSLPPAFEVVERPEESRLAEWSES